MENTKSQMWFTDFVIALLLFSFVMIAYYSYTSNVQDEDAKPAERLRSDVEAISSSLLSSGYPIDWNNNTVQSIGITSNDQRINKTKFTDFANMPYNLTKKLLGTFYDYFIFFTNKNGTLMNVEGICGIGTQKVNITYNINPAYYYDNGADSFLKSFMINPLQAGIYSPELGNNFDDLANNINKYDFIAIEHPLLSASTFDNNEEKIENAVANGSLLMLSGEIVSAQGKEMAGVKFYKKSGQSTSDRNSTVVAQDEFLSFNVDENIVFRQAYYVENQSGAKNFTNLVKFNLDNNTAVARWDYGNGSVFYFSDFDVDYFSGNFMDKITQAIKKWGKFQCNFNISNIKYKNLVPVERYLIYDSKPIKMVLYIWDEDR